jgi:hypothetical protein
MNIGMLWFDNNPKSDLSAKIDRAAKYYLDKYGKSPTTCYVHPDMLKAETQGANENPLKSGPVVVKTSASVLPHHFWIGVNGQAKNEAGK